MTTTKKRTALRPQLKAAIDLGTNTCLLLIADWDTERKQVSRVVGDFSTVVRLGEGVDQARAFAPAAMDRTLLCLKTYSARIREAGLEPGDVVCVATSQARDSQNGEAFFNRVTQETGLRFQVISGANEARFTFMGGLLPEMDPRASVVIDIGGGSTELMTALSAQSVDIGCVRYTERFLKHDPIQDQEFWACQESIDSELISLQSWRKILPASAQLVAVAGTATTLAAWHLGLEKFDAAQIDSVLITRGDVHRMVEELKWRTVAERCQLPCIEPGRADVLLAGALILWRAMELLEFSACHVSTRGLRYGVLSQVF